VNLTAGFFKLSRSREVWFSGDHTVRAENTYMVVKQSVNDGLLPVGREWWTQCDYNHGVVAIKTDAWVPTLATASLATLYAYSGEPDIAPSGGGPTIPVGKLLHGAAEVTILAIMMSLGTGIYEIRGQPFDYVRARNTTEAVNSAAQPFAWREVELENDLLASDQAAQAFAVRELLRRNAEAHTWGATIVDDPRIEVGDIAEMPDKSRLFVTDYRRDLTRGAPAKLRLEGFRA
jgi:hypothetical protein